MRGARFLPLLLLLLLLQCAYMPIVHVHGVRTFTVTREHAHGHAAHDIHKRSQHTLSLRHAGRGSKHDERRPLALPRDSILGVRAIKPEWCQQGGDVWDGASAVCVPKWVGTQCRRYGERILDGEYDAIYTAQAGFVKAKVNLCFFCA